LWQALGVKPHRDHAEVPVVPKEARDLLDAADGNGADAPERELSPPDAPAHERPIVLIVDDDAGIRDALRFALDEHYTVLDAPHGRSGIGIVRTERVDLVLLDILMPEVDGLEILQELKALAPDLPVIMMTAVKTVRTTVAAMKLGAADYVTKPFQEDELLASIRQALAQRARRLGPPVERDRAERDARPRTHRLLFVGGDPGWRATLAVVLSPATGVETSPTLVDGLNRMLRFRPTCVVLNVKRSTVEAGRFLGALNAQLPACPVLVVCDDVYLGAPPVWETLNIRGVLRPPVRFEDLLSRIGAVLPPGDSLSGPWPRLGESVGRTIAHLSRHYDEDLTVDSIAEITDISASHLAHLFRSEIGMSVRDYLTRVRVAIAQDLLAHTDEKLESIAARLGFADTSHLAHVFQRIIGRPPSAYRRTVR
jgi:FixJ family two-component response regulator/AraC-like DNA-binding protein